MFPLIILIMDVFKALLQDRAQEQVVELMSVVEVVRALSQDSSTALRGAQSGVGRQGCRFTGRIWMLLVVGEYGFIESDSAKAAFGHALVGDIRFFINGSFRLDDWVTFSVGEGLHGLEAFDLEAVGRE